MYVPRAAGFVVVRERDGSIEYLVLENREREEPGFPKGHVEGAETDLETARREATEETGLLGLEPDPWFRAEIVYPVVRESHGYEKTVVYFLARAPSGEVVHLSPEHRSFAWLPLDRAREAIRFENLRGVLREAALFLKDPALFDLEPVAEADARTHLLGLPHAHEDLVAHLEGSARLARRLATGLREAGVPCHVEATAAGTLLHDVGRALGQHEDHQRAGLRHLRLTALAPYGFACISHFTKGASHDELIAAGLEQPVVQDFHKLVDCTNLTWEEQCAAMADACMKGGEPVPPAVRFEDLRGRYPGAVPLVDLQEQRTEAIRQRLGSALGRDPLDVLALAR